jgi:hypothetical protein
MQLTEADHAPVDRFKLVQNCGPNQLHSKCAASFNTNQGSRVLGFFQLSIEGRVTFDANYAQPRREAAMDHDNTPPAQPDWENAVDDIVRSHVPEVRRRAFWRGFVWGGGSAVALSIPIMVFLLRN